MVGTLAIVSGATLLTVGYLNVRIARSTRDTIEAQIRESITRKGEGLATNHALALRGLVADNAFGDVAHLVERAVRQDHEMVYGLFLGSDGRPWTYVPPLSATGPDDQQPNWHELGIDPEESRTPDPQSRLRVVYGQTVFEFSAPVDSDDGVVLGPPVLRAVARAARPRARGGAPRFPALAGADAAADRRPRHRHDAAGRDHHPQPLAPHHRAAGAPDRRHHRDRRRAQEGARVDRERGRDRHAGPRVQPHAPAARRVVPEARGAEPHARAAGPGAHRGAGRAQPRHAAGARQREPGLPDHLRRGNAGAGALGDRRDLVRARTRGR